MRRRGLAARLWRRVAHRLRRLLAADEARQRAALARLDQGAWLGPGARIVNTAGPDAIRIGAYSQLFGELAIGGAGGRIVVGDWTLIREDTRIRSRASVTIGNHVGISHLVDIADDAGAEPLPPAAGTAGPNGSRGEPRSIVIEDDVWIGCKSTILKGVRIGRGAMVAAGSLVVEDVPARAYVAGSPAIVVRRNRP
jgi:acetyltransferase-like isoleucine patch superfamily enzyme